MPLGFYCYVVFSTYLYIFIFFYLLGFFELNYFSETKFYSIAVMDDFPKPNFKLLKFSKSCTRKCIIEHFINDMKFSGTCTSNLDCTPTEECIYTSAQRYECICKEGKTLSAFHQNVS